MKVGLLLVAAIAAAQRSTTPSPAAEDSHPGPNNDQSLVSTILQSAGYSELCIAETLNYCSSAQEGSHYTSLIEEVTRIGQQVNLVLQKLLETPPRHCQDLLDSGDSGRGLRDVYPYPQRPNHPVTVYCDHTIDGGGWTVFQRRTNRVVRQNFEKGWRNYASGFGDLNGEFWLGLHHLHGLTSTIPQQLRVDLYDYEGGHRWAKYGTFYVGAPETNYSLSIGRYSGNAGDSMARHNGSQFSTYDADHDKDSYSNCAEVYYGGWWYNACHQANLNGYQYEGEMSGSYKFHGIRWRHWRHSYSLRQTTMMIRPARWGHWRHSYSLRRTTMIRPAL